MPNLNTLNPPSFEGFFWMSDTPDIKWPGNFFCDEDGHLQLDILYKDSMALLFNPNQFDGEHRIIGLTKDGEAITFENCLLINQSFSIPGIAKISFVVQIAIIGCSFEKDEPIRFNEISMYSEGVDRWLQLAPIKVENPFIDKQNSNEKELKIRFAPPQPIEWSLENNIKMRITSSWTGPAMDTFHEAKITAKSWLSFTYPEEMSLEKILNVPNRFYNLISFIVDETISPNEIVVHSDKLKQENYKIPIKIFYQPIINPLPKSSYINLRFSLFAFKDVRDHFGEIFSRWLNSSEKYAPSFNLFFSLTSRRSLYLENRFLMIVQALESLHRLSSDESAFPLEDYKNLTDILESSLKGSPKIYREWLRSKLQYGNEPSLRKRLKSLTNGFEDCLGDSKKISCLINLAVNTRNYLTHFDVSLKKKAAQREELHELYSWLEILLQLHMATFLGFSKDEAIDLFRKSETFKRKLDQIYT